MKPATQLSLPSQLAAQAELVVNSLKHTDYQHVEKVDVDRGVYDCDCNAFLSFLLLRTAPEHYQLIPKETTQLRPRAFEYYLYFHSLTSKSTVGWHRINFMRDVRRGDIVAWQLSPEIKKGVDTGHVLVLAETPTENSDGTFKVRIYDSAAKPHFEDTRGTGPGQFPTGVGSGFLNFKVDAEGRPTEFQFSPGHGFEKFPIAIGRLEPFPQ
jgi:hypothetical protein